MSLGPHEIVSIVFLVVYFILLPPSIYLWVKYIRAGFSWRYGFYGATLCCLTRVGAFITELIFYSEHKDYSKQWLPAYSSDGAFIAYVVMLSIGFIGLIDCESSLFTSWAEKNLSLNPIQGQITGKIRLLNLAALGLLIGASVDRGSSNPSDQSTAVTLTKIGIILFLILTLIQAAFLAYGWLRSHRFSETLVVLTIAMGALLVRIIFSTYSVFHASVSVFNLYSDNNIKYLVGPFLLMEIIALVLMIGIGLHNVRQTGFSKNNDTRETPVYEHVMTSNSA